MRDAHPAFAGTRGPVSPSCLQAAAPTPIPPSAPGGWCLLPGWRWPGALFCLVGKHRRDGRTTTSFGAAELNGLRGVLPSAFHAVDLPLTDQLAIVAGCDVLISLYSGFGMAALAVDALGEHRRNRWPEYYFNGVPFYSVLPDLERSPPTTPSSPIPRLWTTTGRGRRACATNGFATTLPRSSKGPHG